MKKSLIFAYGLTIFLSSAILLVLEITAGRLIAPYVGVTVYSWTAIIGVILAGLAIGNWLGGVLVDKGYSTKTIGVVLALSSISSIASLYILSFVAEVLQTSDIDVISASFFYVLSMFFLPAILLGVPTPMLTTLSLKLSTSSGKIVGTMHALAAVGSIFGTFITGFVLIQYIGSRNIVIFSAILLLILAIPFLLKSLKTLLTILVFGGVIIFLANSRNSFANPCEVESSYFCIRTTDASDMFASGEAKALILDHLMHGINHKQDPELIASPYVELMHNLVLNHFGDKNLSYYFIGGGAYTHPRLVALNPKNKITVAEIDEKVTKIAKEKLFVDIANMQIIHNDARRVLHIINKKFDVVVADAFADITIPYHLITKEFIALAKSKMSKDGIFMINIVDIFPDPLMVKSFIKTLKTQFNYVDIWLDEIPRVEKRLTFVISASDKIIDNNIIYSSITDNKWYNITKPLNKTKTKLSELEILTDDFVPVERLMNSLLTSSKGL